VPHKTIVVNIPELPEGSLRASWTEANKSWANEATISDLPLNRLRISKMCWTR